MKPNRPHKKIGQKKAKRIALKDITKECKVKDGIYSMNYISRESEVWQLLKNFNPIVFRINTSIL